MGLPHSLRMIPLSSITSIELQKITLRVMYVLDGGALPREIDAERWALIDEQLCGLVGRLSTMGYCGTLGVELRLMNVGDDPERCDSTQFVPGFRRVGL